MNKETFLSELRGYLQILEDQEQEDILEEYAQHIDIKIQKGQSEEEAIRDFGSVRPPGHLQRCKRRGPRLFSSYSRPESKPAPKPAERQ